MSVESVVSFLIGKLASLLEKEVELLKDVSKEVRLINDELQSMKAFLIDADLRADGDAGVKRWVAEVREAAYNIEDVLDEYALRLFQEPIHHSHKVMIFLRKTMHHMKNLKKRHQIAKQIQELKINVDGISSRAKKYKFKKMEHDTSSSNAPSDSTRHLRSTARFMEEANLVGIDNPRTELIGLLVAGESRLMTISIAGMGGLGKTTLAGKVYDNERVKTHFEAFAWVTVSQTLIIEEIFRSILKQICRVSNKEAKSMNKDDLIEKLRSYLQQKRYVIVLDDIWKVDDWKCIEIGLPEGKCGSRVLVTTRISEVANACASTSNHVYGLQSLTPEQGMALFIKKAFRSESGGNCPRELKSISEKFVQKCGGLPLAIEAIGGLLWTKPKTLAEWQKLYNSLGHLIEISDSMTNMNQILLLSYNDLPYYLKTCFMYVSIFPEDYLIKPMRLIQLWLAEGFVERKEGITLEELVVEYLHELINRSLIQAASYTDYGTLEACRLHDVVREIILSKAREEKFLTFQNGTEVIIDKTRRLALRDYVEIAPKNDSSHLRSFFVFQSEKWPMSSMNAWLSAFRLLKVLDLEGTLIDEFPSEIINLFHLRYLNLSRTVIRTLPEDIGKLKNLETLNIQYTYVETLPASIVKLVYLRYLLVQPDSLAGCRNGVKVNSGVGNLRFLQQLGYIKSDQGNGVLIQELGKLTKLKWLGISEVTSEDGRALCDSIEKMACLSSLSALSEIEGAGTLNLNYISSPPRHLEHVFLKGHLEELPNWISKLSNLVHLELSWSRLEEDPFVALQDLPNLMMLELRRAYDGEELCCGGMGFQRLNSLFIHDLNKLKLMRLEKGAMSNLQKLLIDACPKFNKVPFGIEHLNRLKDLEFRDAPDALGKSIGRVDSEERQKISHVPLLRFTASAYSPPTFIYNRNMERACLAGQIPWYWDVQDPMVSGFSQRL